MYSVRRPTRGEYLVLFTVLGLIFFGFGVAGLYFGLQAPEEKKEAAEELVRYSFISIACGVVSVFFASLFRRWS